LEIHRVQLLTNATMTPRVNALVLCSHFASRCVIATSLVDVGIMPSLTHDEKSTIIELLMGRYSYFYCEDVLLTRDLCRVSRALCRDEPLVKLVVLSLKSEWDAYLVALRARACDYLRLPTTKNEVMRLLTRASSRTPSSEVYPVSCEMEVGAQKVPNIFS